MKALEWVLAHKIIAIVRELPTQYMVKLAEALYAGGIDLIEVTFSQSKPESWKDTVMAIRTIEKHMTGKMLVGAGTVVTREQLEMAYDAGAKYIVTPHTNPDLIGRMKEYGLPCFPGALTPSEIVAAYEAGADSVKIFPAAQLGPAYIKAIKAPLNNIPLIAVGGVNEKNVVDFLAAGCCGVGVGGNLVNKSWIESGSWDRITALSAEYRKAVG